MLRIDSILGHALIVDEPERFNSLLEHLTTLVTSAHNSFTPIAGLLIGTML